MTRLNDLRGIIRRSDELDRFQLKRVLPSEEFSEFIEHFWDVRWNLQGKPDFQQEVLPHPSVQLVVEPGQSGVFGVVSDKFVKILSGDSGAFGCKFRPGMFSALLEKPMSSMTEQVFLLEDVFGEEGAKYEAEVLGSTDLATKVKLAEEFLLPRCQNPDSDAVLARTIVERIANDPELIRVKDIVDVFSLSTRKIQRLFNRYVGVVPKWVIQRYRLHEALARLQSAETVDLKRLAIELGYFDQAHFASDFRRMVGQPPCQYAQSFSADPKAGPA